MNHETPFLIALGMLTAAAFVVGVSGWILFARDHSARKLRLSAATAGTGADAAGSSPSGTVTANPGSAGSTTAETNTGTGERHDHHHEVAEES